VSVTENQIEGRLRENLARIQQRIDAAAQRAGRVNEGKTYPRLMAVTKYVEPETARLLAEMGVWEMGESRPQELWRKAEALSDLKANVQGKPYVAWHLIGHLQRNKVRRTLPHVACIDSVDSMRLVEEIHRETSTQPCPVTDVLLEVNVSGEPAKHGFRPEELEPLLPQIATLKHVCVLGLMGMAALEGGLDEARRNFAALRELRDRLRLNCPPWIVLDELSMGMSEDFEVAIEEGATIVRVGSALFEGVV
jgi:PLP dependent protein